MAPPLGRAATLTNEHLVAPWGRASGPGPPRTRLQVGSRETHPVLIFVNIVVLGGAGLLLLVGLGGAAR